MRTDQKRKFKLPVSFTTEWVTSMLYDLATLQGFKAEASWINERLYFIFEQKHIETAIEQLFKIKLLSNDEYTGKLQRKHPSVSTGDQVSSDSVAKYHRAMFNLSSEVLDKLPHERVHFFGELISVNVDEYQELVKDLRQIAQNILNDSEKCLLPTQVYQFNSQLFPMKSWT